VIKIRFIGFGKKRKYPFVENLIPSIFGGFSKGKTTHFWYSLARLNWQPRGSFKCHQTLLIEAYTIAYWSL